MTALCASKSVDGRVKPGHDGAGRVARPPPVAYLLAMTAAQNAREPMPSVASAHDKILIVDFGSQVTQLIARRVREEGVYSEIVPFQKAEAAFREMKPKAVILSGGPEFGSRGRLAARPASHLRFRRARARHLLRPDDHGRPARRRGRGRPSPRVRPRRCRGQDLEQSCSTTPGRWAKSTRCG